MKIGFVNYTPMYYSVETPYKKPLGGSESALCYLAEHLAKLGHEVTLFGRLPKIFVSRGVRHESDQKLFRTPDFRLDFLIIQNTPFNSFRLKEALGAKTKLIFWSQHATNQPSVKCLKEKRFSAVHDAIILISRWQLEDYLETFPLKRDKCFILRNAISPAFENLFSGQFLLAQKANPPILAYTSTPFRGLDLLIKLFPRIRKEVPNVELKIFSSMKVYQAVDQEEEQDFGELYRLCQKTEGVQYVGSISQTELAQELKKTFSLAYPNIFPETSCISAMEAMAAGCCIITSKLGALPETTAGFARLIALGPSEEQYSQSFVDETVNTLKKFVIGEHEELSDNLTRQVIFANNCYTWKKRALEWEMLLKELG